MDLARRPASRASGPAPRGRASAAPRAMSSRSSSRSAASAEPVADDLVVRDLGALAPLASLAPTATLSSAATAPVEAESTIALRGHSSVGRACRLHRRSPVRARLAPFDGLPGAGPAVRHLRGLRRRPPRVHPRVLRSARLLQDERRFPGMRLDLLRRPRGDSGVLARGDRAVGSGCRSTPAGPWHAARPSSPDLAHGTSGTPSGERRGRERCGRPATPGAASGSLKIVEFLAFAQLGSRHRAPRWPRRVGSTRARHEHGGDDRGRRP